MPLVLSTDLPHGNLALGSSSESEGVAVVTFAAHPHGGPESLWFCFRMAQPEPPVSLSHTRLVLEHPTNMLGGWPPANMRPVLRRAEGDWERLGPPEVATLPDGRLTASWVIETPRTFADLAFCYPYGVPEVEALVAETGGYWRADCLGVSQGGRPLMRLSNEYGAPGGERPGLYLVARQHSGETPGSWVLDGVEQGDYGKDNFPYDLNRAWGVVPMRHETLVFQHDLRRWQDRCRPALTIDFHAPGACESDGVYCYLPNSAQYADQHQVAYPWAERLARALSPEFAAEPFGRIADYPSRWETPTFTAHCWAEHQVCGLSIETPYALARTLVLTREHYREVGARMAEAITEGLQPLQWCHVRPPTAAQRRNTTREDENP